MSHPRLGVVKRRAPTRRTAIYTGLRLGELLGLQWGDIDLEAGVHHVRRQFTLTGED